MTNQRHYEWLIIVEGNTDLRVFQSYLFNDNCKVIPAGGSITINMPFWNQNLIMTLKTDLARAVFKGVILVIDSDESSNNPFKKYVRSNDPGIRYVGSKPNPYIDSTNTCWHLDNIIGHNIIPLKGINAPFLSHGGLESELLIAYGFPTKEQSEHSTLVDIIKRTTNEWNIPNNKDGTSWWTVNEVAKMDKFIYVALESGFKVSGITPTLPDNPDIITRIRKTMIDITEGSNVED